MVDKLQLQTCIWNCWHQFPLTSGSRPHGCIDGRWGPVVRRREWLPSCYVDPESYSSRGLENEVAILFDALESLGIQVAVDPSDHGFIEHGTSRWRRRFSPAVSLVFCEIGTLVVAYLNFLCQSTGGNHEDERDEVRSLVSSHTPPKELEGPS